MKTLREKCINNEVKRMIDSVNSLVERWGTTDMCYKRPEKYIFESLGASDQVKKNTRGQTP